MKYLRYLSDEYWSTLPVADFRARFFVECFIEKLRAFTPHFYQARLMNMFSACSEMLGYIDELSANEKNLAYLISSIREVESCWKSDLVVQEVLVDLNRFQDVISRAVKSGNIDGVGVHRLRAFCKAVLARAEQYEAALSDAVCSAVAHPAGDIEQKERVADSINKLTGLYVTHLLNQGYSPTYLFNRHEMFTRAKNYAGRDFAAQLTHVVQRLRSHTDSFECHFIINTVHVKALKANSTPPGFAFIDILDESLAGFDLKAANGAVSDQIVAKVTMISTDHVSAALRSKEVLNEYLDVVTAFDSRYDLTISASCLVLHQVQATMHKRHVPVDKLLTFMSSEIVTRFSDPANSISNVQAVLESESKDQLGRSLRYLRLSKQSVSLEQKLLNLWIAFESLFVDLGSGIIGNMLDYVPVLYATAGLSRRVKYLRDLLDSNSVAVPLRAQGKIFNKARFDRSLTIDQVFMLLRDESLAVELFGSLAGKEHLKFKLMQIFNELKDNKSLVDRLAKTEGDVTRQLRRIYFMRNKITHTGRFNGVRPQLVTHLSDYLGVCYEVLFAAAGRAKPGSKYTLIELLTAAKIGAEIVSAKCTSKDRIVSMDQLLIAPAV